MSAARDTVKIPQPLGLFAGELLTRSIEYADAFERLEVKANSRFLHSGFYLLSHSVELALKAFLAAKGVAKRELWSRRLGHDLLALELAATQRGLPLVANLSHLNASLDVMNGDHALRYPAGYFASVPAPDECLEAARELQRAIHPTVDSASLAQRLMLAGDERYRGKRIEWTD